MAKIRAYFKDFSESNNILSEAKCLLSVSVGQQSHEADWFGSTVELINRHFSGCVISLYDSLQRYTMAMQHTKSADFFHSIAIKEGDLWLERNSNYLAQFKNLETIYRWDMWLQHPNFTHYRDEIKQLINTDENYKAVFDRTVDKYLNKYCGQLKHVETFDKFRAQRLCMEYIIEECAVLRLWPELQCQYEIYPSIHNDAILETGKRFIATKQPDLLQPLTLRFRNAPQLKPQRFELLVTA